MIIYVQKFQHIPNNKRRKNGQKKKRETKDKNNYAVEYEVKTERKGKEPNRTERRQHMYEYKVV